MRALVLTGPGRSEVRDVPAPVAGPGEVVVEVARVGVCGTDAELFSGEMEYVEQGLTTYPFTPGHEWCGTVVEVGSDVDVAWLGRRVTGDTMLGCGVCPRCRAGRHHVCEQRSEIGIRGDYPGALAERLRVPAGALLALPDAVDDTAGAMVEPGGNALRAVRAAALAPGERLLVVGTGTIGLLVASFAGAAGLEVHLAGVAGPSLEFAASLWPGRTSTLGEVEPGWDAVVDASSGSGVPATAVRLVEPGRRVVLIGLAAGPSTLDTRELVLRDVTAVGVLAASAGLDGAVTAYAEGRVDPAPLVGAVVGLDEVHDVLAGHRPAGAGGPKVHVDPRA
ncbi:alcohol dehydrogenase catalytic domain-containing protein [Nocardioides flavescens]|uniref:Alcohol dehydrogenase catalytic domain-containing protein n=1 Tax=Nocardioides flavescens TaxID=2691959 RepID=A0A6L7F0I5_9ACTN|nr:alcohol dehydrogenase catalytic domain-containing protein [Nocardioides flavescens]